MIYKLIYNLATQILDINILDSKLLSTKLIKINLKFNY